MKKALLFLLLAATSLISIEYANAMETKSSDYVVVQEQTVDESAVDVVVLKETNNAKIVRDGNKIGIIDKRSGNYILRPIIDSIDNSQFNNENEYKFKIDDHTGYVNVENGVNFLTNYDDIIPVDNYLKIKKDNKYGLIDKEGNVILKPIFQKVSVINNDGKEYISGKYEGKYKMFYNTGNLIPDNELYTIEKDSKYTLAEDLNPIFKAYRQENKTIYQKASNAEDKMIYEIKEIPLPMKTKTAAIEKNEPFTEKEQNIFNIDNTDFIIVNNKGKIGLSDKNNEEVIPAVFDSLSVKRPCTHSNNSKGIILASNNNNYSAYDKKGKLLAEEVYNKINVYKYGKVYSLTNENGQYILRANGKQIGVLTVDNNGYEFTKTKFHPYSMHKIYELLILFFTIA